MVKHSGQRKTLASWASKVCPAWCFSLFRDGAGVRHWKTFDRKTEADAFRDKVGPEARQRLTPIVPATSTLAQYAEHWQRLICPHRETSYTGPLWRNSFTPHPATVRTVACSGIGPRADQDVSRGQVEHKAGETNGPKHPSGPEDDAECRNRRWPDCRESCR